MSTPTWGIYIPGYSYPSPAQRSKFEKMYPGVAARYREDMERDVERYHEECNAAAEAEWEAIRKREKS